MWPSWRLCSKTSGWLDEARADRGNDFFFWGTKGTFRQVNDSVSVKTPSKSLGKQAETTQRINFGDIKKKCL